MQLSSARNLIPRIGCYSLRRADTLLLIIQSDVPNDELLAADEAHFQG